MQFDRDPVMGLDPGRYARGLEQGADLPLNLLDRFFPAGWREMNPGFQIKFLSGAGPSDIFLMDGKIRIARNIYPGHGRHITLSIRTGYCPDTNGNPI